MNQKQRRILEDEETFDIEKVANIIQETNTEQSSIPARKRSLQAWRDKKIRDQKTEMIRQTLAKHWQKKH